MSEPTDRLLDRAMAAEFREWYRERRRREHAREGNFQYNGPRDPLPTDVHYPSSLLKCHRKRRYLEANAPAEEPAPNGIFWAGRSIETELVHPFLEDRIAGPAEYVTRGIGFEAEVKTTIGAATDSLVDTSNAVEADEAEVAGGGDGTDEVHVASDGGEMKEDIGSLRLRGRTDPVVTTETGEPLIPTEVKTRRDFSRFSGPSEPHRAQVHAGLYALSARYGIRVEDALLIYVSTKTLDQRLFQVSFDASFWRDRVVPWMQLHTQLRADGRLPPADPEQFWECDYCDFRGRCGKGDQPVADLGPVGFLPRYEYPREAVEDHLDATDAALTPTLAAAYPDLAATAKVADWICPACGDTRSYGAVEWSGAGDSRPNCSSCASDGDHVLLRGPFPATGWDGDE